MATTLAKALATGQRQLTAENNDASFEAELLLAHAINQDRVWVFTHPERILSRVNERRYSGLLARRIKGEPIAYLLGYRDFYKHRFVVNSHTLIPRPETELLVERVLELTDADQPFQLLDLGTGSGVIGVSIAAMRPNSVVVATDVSEHALGVARLNADRLKTANIEFRAGSWFSPTPGQRFDLVVSNPPYVEDGFDGVSGTDLQFEPPNALLAGTDGLDALQAIAAGLPDALYPGGRVLLEHGASQSYAVSVLLQAHGLRVITCHKDMAGHERLTEAIFD